MALLFNSNIRNLMIGRGLMNGFSYISPNFQGSISVYAGTQPTAAQITSSWATYASTSANFLLHYTGQVWGQPSYGTLLQLYPQGNTVASNTGIATWCILWSSNVTSAQVAASTLPSTAFIVGPVSDTVGQGIVRFTSTSITSGATITITDGSIGATSF